jgi:hypothetical protein
MQIASLKIKKIDHLMGNINMKVFGNIYKILLMLI